MGRPLNPSKRQLESGRWQVRGTFAGRPYKRHFLHESEADAALSSLAGALPLPALPTTLTPQQLREAEGAIAVLPDGLNLRDAVRLALLSWKPSASWDSAVEKYEAAAKVRGTSEDRIKDVLQSVARFRRWCGTDEIDVPASEVESWLDLVCKTPATRRHRRADLSSFFGWCQKRGLCSSNPVALVEAPKVRKAPPEVVSPEVVEALFRDLEANHPSWVPYFALCIFAGVRPDGEARRIDEGLRAGRTPLLPGGFEVRHPKTGHPRIIPWEATGPLRDWLAAYPLGSRLIPDETGLRGSKAKAFLEAFRSKHGLGHDVMRHVAASCMTYSGRMSLAEVTFALGNSDHVLRKNYVGRWDRSMTARVWGIVPAKAPERVVVPATA